MWKFLVLLIAIRQSAVAQSVRFILPETGNAISLRFRPTSDRPNTFRSVQITWADKHFLFPAKNPIARIPATQEERRTSGFWVDIPGLKLHPGRYFLVGSYGSSSDSHTLLFFISEAGGSEAAALLVIGFSATGEPYKVLERNYLDVTSFESATDGTALIVGKEALSQVMGGDGGNGSIKPYATTYDPFAVFTLQFGDKAVYSLAASQTYNRAHYVWAGAHSREDYAVLYNLPGHHGLVGAPAARVEALLQGEGKKKP